MLPLPPRPFITLTGIDARTDLFALPADCELGLLFTATPEARTRYPEREQLALMLQALRGRHTALHVCGRGARDMLSTKTIPDLTDYVQRIQVNGQVEPDELLQLCSLYPHHVIITQHTERNAALIDLKASNHALLVDGSGGRGLLPASWVSPLADKPVGFAGGLGPDNVSNELSRIREITRDGWWVDMENKLRDASDWFDVGHAGAVIAACGGK